MMAPKLSICIATRNRCDYIGATLESIVSQLSDDVEIVVVDGASTDRTAEIVQKYNVAYPQIRYIYLHENGGIDKDYDICVTHTLSEYCWLMSDDDLLNPGALMAVLKVLQDNHDLIIVNAVVKNKDLSLIVEPKRLHIDKDKIYYPNQIDSFFIDVGAYLSFIGCVVIKRNLWKSRPKEQYYGSAFVHMGVIFQSPLENTVLVMAHPWICIRYGNASWSSRAFDIWMFSWPKLIWSFPSISDAAKSSVSPREPSLNFKSLLRYRAIGVYGLKEYREKIAPRPGSRIHKMMAKLIASIPGSAINTLALVAQLIMRPDAKLLNADLRNSPYYLGRRAAAQKTQAS